MSATPEQVARTWEVAFVHSAVTSPRPGAKPGSTMQVKFSVLVVTTTLPVVCRLASAKLLRTALPFAQLFKFSLPTAQVPVPPLEVTVRVTLHQDGSSSVALEGSAYEYSGAAFASAAQSLLSAALEDKRRRVLAGLTAST